MMNIKIAPFISQEAIQKRIRELGQSIAQKHPTEGIVLVSSDELEYHFVRDLKQSIGERATIARRSEEWNKQDKNCIFVVQCLSESGNRLEKVYSQFEKDKTDLVYSVCLLQRITSEKVIREPDYLGFSIPDEFVVGYGMGVQGKYDSLSHIAIYDAS